MYYNSVPFLSAKNCNFGQKVGQSWTAHHALLENIHLEGTKNPYYILPLKGGSKEGIS